MGETEHVEESVEEEEEEPKLVEQEEEEEPELVEGEEEHEEEEKDEEPELVEDEEEHEEEDEEEHEESNQLIKQTQPLFLKRSESVPQQNKYHVEQYQDWHAKIRPVIPPKVNMKVNP